jgi:hypothetical protein
MQRGFDVTVRTQPEANGLRGHLWKPFTEVLSSCQHVSHQAVHPQDDIVNSVHGEPIVQVATLIISQTRQSRLDSSVQLLGVLRLAPPVFLALALRQFLPPVLCLLIHGVDVTVAALGGLAAAALPPKVLATPGPVGVALLDVLHGFPASLVAKVIEPHVVALACSFTVALVVRECRRRHWNRARNSLREGA